MSLSLRRRSDPKPVPVLRWSPTIWRKMEALRDRIMHGAGTGEPWFTEELTATLGHSAVAVHYPKPLRIDEVSRLASTSEVKERSGRG